MIVTDMQPISIVEDPGFIKFMKVLEPRYHLPGWKTLMTIQIPHLYTEVKTAVQEFLYTASSVVLTTDMWTSRATQAFLTVTAHCIDEEWEIQAYTLDTVNVVEDHTGDNISNVLTQIVEDWGINNKIHAVVADIAPNMVKAVRTNMWKHIPCYAH